jgi:ketosteroid isomerase-like protein
MRVSTKLWLCLGVLGFARLVTAAPLDEIEAVNARVDAALAARDAKLLEGLVAERFTWLHASDGRVDDRNTWLQNAARGTALSGQQRQRTERDTRVDLYGEPPHTAIRVSRVRLLDTANKREMWIRQTRTWIRDGQGAWRLAIGQGVIMYDGALLDAALHARYAGTYALSDGRLLTLAWKDESLLATLPSGAVAQVFLGSPTDEVMRAPAAGALHFTLDAEGKPSAVSLLRAGQEIWRAVRK